MYFVKAQIVYKVQGTIQSCARAGDSRTSQNHAHEQEIHKSHKNHAYEQEIHKGHKNHASEQEIHKCHKNHACEQEIYTIQENSYVLAGDSQKSCVRPGDSHNSR